MRKSDPVVRWLVVVIALVLVIWLAAIVSAMVFGLLTPIQRRAPPPSVPFWTPRPSSRSGKADAKTYALYVGVLLDAGQLSKAQTALDQALKTAKTDRSYLYARQAQLLSPQKDYKGAVTAADKAMAEAKKELKSLMDENVKANRKASAGAVLPTSYGDAALIKAEALLASEDYNGAIKVFDVYLKGSRPPQMCWSNGAPRRSKSVTRRAQRRTFALRSSSFRTTSPPSMG